MHPSLGDVVHYLPEGVVVMSQMPSVVFSAEDLVIKVRKKLATENLYPATLVKPSEIDEKGLSDLRKKIAELLTKRKSFVFQGDALRAKIRGW